MKNVGKPCAGEPHARFDGRGLETGRQRGTAPVPDPPTKLYPAADHGKGDRWQVRWRDEIGQQRKRNFAKRDGTDPEKCASAFDAKTKTTLDDGTYINPGDANITLQAFAEDWRKTRDHDIVRAARIERLLRRHIYPDPATPGKTPTGAPAIGHRRLTELSKRPSLVQAWIAGMKLGTAGSKGQVITLASSIFIAAIDDGLISRNPTRAQSVRRPKPAEEGSAMDPRPGRGDVGCA